MANQWGQSDAPRLQSAVLTIGHVLPTMETIFNSVTQLRKCVADLGAMKSGNVENVVIHAGVKMLHGSTETDTHHDMQTAVAFKTQT